MSNIRKFMMLTASTAVFAVTGAMAQDAVVVENADTEPAAERTLEVVTVKGIRGSIERGLALKENSDSIVDGAFAEELGKFPDTNVAESLQRITGVAITRARGGEGRFVTVRGLGEEFNNVTYNGRTLATENLGREFSFDVIASELISKAEVYKSSEARHADGSIGGLINVATARPLSDPGFHVSGSFAGEYDNLAEDTGFRASGIISNSFANDTIGVLASFSTQQRDLRSDTYESIDYRTLDLVQRGAGGSNTTNLSVFDAGAGDTAADIVSTGVHSTYSAGINRESRERVGGTLAVQFQPNSDVDIIADVLYTNYKSPGESNFTTAYFPNFRDGSVSVDRQNGYITGWTGDFTSDYVARSFQSDTDTLQIGLNGDWQYSDNLRFNGDLAWSKADGRRDNNGSDAGGGNFLVLGIQGAVGTFTEMGQVDGLTVQVPTYDPAAVGNTGLDGNPVVGGAGTGLVDISQADPRLLDAHFNRVSEFTVEDEVTSLRLSGEYDINDSSVLSFGVDYVDREKTNNLFLNSAGQIEFCCYAANFESLNPALFGGFASPITDSFLNSNVPQGFLGFSAAGFRDYFSGLNVGVFGSQGLGLNAGTPLSTTPVLEPLFQDAASNTVQEQIMGGFVQLNIEGELSGIPYQANGGVRLAKTDLTSIGAQAQIESVAVGTDMTSQQFNLTAPLPVSISGDYTNFLPSANIKFDLTDELALRVAASKTISRPTLTDVSTRFAVTSQNIGTETISQGNPGLEAPESTNFDVSLEYYGNNGFAANASIFRKDIEGFVGNRLVPQVITFTELAPANLPAGLTAGQRTVDSSQPTNAESAEITGLELAGQYLHDSGFGVQANVTLVESSATFNGVDADLENVSPLSYNISGFFENDRFSARLSYNFREGYLATTQGLQSRSEFTDDYGQLDFTSSLNVTDNISVFLDAVNLTEEASYTYSEEYQIIRNYEENGRRILFGARANF